MKNNYLTNKKFYKENRENDGIKISVESLSRSGKSEETVHYPFTITNISSEPVNLKFEVEEAGWEVMEVALDLGEEQTVEIKPEKTYEMELQVKVSKRVAPGGYENQKLIIKKEDNKSGQQEMLDEIIFTTLRYLPHPYLLHTEEGWENVKDKMDNYEWMAEILEKIEKKHVSWEVPEIDPSGDFIFEKDSCKPAFPLSVAWKLTANKKKAEKYAAKIKEFLLKLSDPEKGYPETGKGSSHYAVKEGLLFRHAAAAYDLICETDILTEVEKSQIEATFNKFIRDWSRTEKKIINKNGQFTMGVGLNSDYIGNHHLSIVVAGVYISLILQDFNHLNRFLYGPGGFTEQMANGMMDDGFWYETDPGYHMLVADFFIKIARACKPWGINLFDLQVPPKYNRYAGLREEKERQKFGPNYRNSRNISDMLDCLVPLADYRGVIFANNKSWEVRLGGGHLEQFYEHYRKPEYAWALRQKKRGSLQTLLYGIPELPEVEDSRPEIVNSENAGFYVLRSSFDKEEPEKQLQAVLKCGTPGGGHRHYDQTNLLSIMRYGRSFYNTQSAWWGGVYHHMYYDWLIKSANHNMVIVDQGNQGVTSPEKLLLKKGEKFKSAAVQVKVPWAYMSFWPKGTEEKIKDLGTILQRRLMTVTEDYIIVADYLADLPQGEKGKQSHIYDW
ncbi:MAG: hypothetical protein ACOCV3_08455, partial [Halanaerobiales bacterium]